ncbi:Hypothetical protein SRAE_X000254600 [Strongyloides ratti]|uniref:Uncharacterized protein n=1 Tax=Strongyloides ratti TaxID=34506 RepID=A0A090MRD3_STRRB|nr:Hypothetical protein SRAE_X000254600 [Strongyloides ratti]CEF60763.1 Hypothetical protein SRAE_X000254600 [Strongyloides ratti]
MELKELFHDNEISNCTYYIKMLADIITVKQWNEYKMSFENLRESDMYTIVILSLFAFIIVVLMVRAIKPSDNIDDQVNLMLNSMRARVDIEHDYREKKKLIEAKTKIQAWLNNVKCKRVGGLSFKNRSSFNITHHQSLDSKIFPHSNKKILNTTLCTLRKQPIKKIENNEMPVINKFSRNSCCSLFVPEIVVTNENTGKGSISSICSLVDYNDDNEANSSLSSCPPSRPLSSNSGECSNSSGGI